MIIKQLAMKSNEEILELLTMQLASYRIEAEWIGFDGIPPLKDGIQSLREAKETFLGCYMAVEGKQELSGAISFSRKRSNYLQNDRAAEAFSQRNCQEPRSASFN
jgi:hypothetical protein